MEPFPCQWDVKVDVLNNVPVILLLLFELLQLLLPPPLFWSLLDGLAVVSSPERLMVQWVAEEQEVVSSYL